jgi:type IV pilus assembly protein PilM
VGRWWSSPPPSVALEIGPSRVTAVALRRGAGAGSVTALATEPVPPGAVVPSLTAENILDRPRVAEAVRRVLHGAGGPRRVALVVPDSAAKVSVVRFDKVPARHDDLEQMVRWQVRKAVPFPIEAAQVGFAPSTDVEGGGREFVVVVFRRDVVESYEGLVQGAGSAPGLVDLASFNLVNLVLAGDQRTGRAAGQDWLLVHLTPQASTLALVRTGQLVFYRNRLTDGQEGLIDLVHQTAMYYEDRLGGRGFDRVVLAATAEALAAEPSDVRQTLQERLRSRVEAIDPRTAVVLSDRLGVAEDDLVFMAAPLGILLREAA